MLIFVYGEDTFRVQEKVGALKAAFQEKFDPTGLNLAEFAIGKKKVEVGDMLGSAHALPFLGQKRMVIIRDLITQTKKAGTKVWVEGFKKTPDSSIVIFWETADPKTVEKKPLFKELNELAEVHHYPFPFLQGAELTKWVRARVSERGGTIEPKALQGLIERVGADLWQMDGEIGKLIAYADGGSITAEMVDELVHASFEGKIFQLIDAVSKRHSEEALRLLQEERWSGANDHYLLTMLGRQVRILITARALIDENPRATKQELAKVLGVHPFVAQKALAQARGFEQEHLRHVHDLLFRFDKELKRGGINPDLAVDLTTVQLAKR